MFYFCHACRGLFNVVAGVEPGNCPSCQGFVQVVEFSGISYDMEESSDESDDYDDANGPYSPSNGVGNGLNDIEEDLHEGGDYNAVGDPYNPGQSSNLYNEIPFVEIEQTNIDTGDECTICLAVFELKEEVRILPCLHLFHDPCISTWLKNHSTCPTCRSNIYATEDNDDFSWSYDEAMDSHSSDNDWNDYDDVINLSAFFGGYHDD